MTIAVCGNHRVVYCTESELAWTLEQMGHTVLRFQENVVPTEDMLTLCRQHQVSLFLYVHTHGWQTQGVMSLDQLIDTLRFHKIKTASFHLDRYWGLRKGDRREMHIGQHAFWHTDVVFTADGGNQKAFADRGVTHEWLPPGVALRHCHPGVYRQKWACDIAFVGARKYHAEYAFRTQLIDWLSAVYGSAFRRFNGDVNGIVREEALNDLYASVKIVVGDSCFGGAPYYWSDRVPETLGRGGFLIHPATAGLEIPGLVTYIPKSLDHLKHQIDHYLTDAEGRAHCQTLARHAVREGHTYHQRMATVLARMARVCL